LLRSKNKMRLATMPRARPMIPKIPQKQIQIPQIRNTLIFILSYFLCHDHDHDHDQYDLRINYTPAAAAAPRLKLNPNIQVHPKETSSS
jgi:hypothetical protein